MKIPGIPVIDIKKPGQMNNELFEALSKVGFFYIKNHGIKESLQKNLFKYTQLFFSEDKEFKMKIDMKKAGVAWRGYFPVGGELTSGKPDQKEGLYFGRELKPSHKAVKSGIPLHGPNQWPPGKKYLEFKKTILTYMNQMEELGQTLMKGIALSLGLPATYFRKRFTNEPTTLFRIFNYPKHIWNDSQDEWGVREHTDMGFLTILLQDKSGGLQVKTLDGHWISAPPIDGTFVINIGDMLEVWTHGIYRATPHRVRNEGEGDRLSIPFFFDPNWSSTLESIEPRLLPQTAFAQVNSQTMKRWDGLNLNELSRDMTYGDFVWAKVKNVFPSLAAK